MSAYSLQQRDQRDGTDELIQKAGGENEQGGMTMNYM